MNISFKNIKVLSFAAMLATGALVVTSCSEDTMDRINEDIDNPHDVESKYILTDAITSTAFSNVSGDFNTYFGLYVEHEVGIYNQLYYAETRKSDVYVSSTFENVWNGIYGTLMSCRTIIQKCSEGGSEAGNNQLKGMAEVLAALNTGVITDAFGDAPFSEAALPLKDGKPQFMNPKLDSQKEIYAGIIKYLDDAIADLQKESTGKAGSQDILFNGDAGKWLKLAYGLKARYTMHALNVAEDKTAALNTVIDCCQKAIGNQADEAAFAIYDGSTNNNPISELFYERDCFGGSQSLADKLVANNDPRASYGFVTPYYKVGNDYQCKQVTPDVAKDFANMAPNGGNIDHDNGTVYNTPVFLYDKAAPTFLQSYHEIKFLEAEAYTRLGNKAKAAEALKEGVTAGLDNFNKSIKQAANGQYLGIEMLNAEGNAAAVSMDESIISAYANKIAGEYNAASSLDAQLKIVMLQKYLAFWNANGESTECYNDVRRLMAEGHKDFYGLQNPGKFPLRAPYGGVTANPNVQAAFGDGQYVFSENVWWAGGSR